MTDKNEPKTPDPYLTIEINDEPKKLKMSYGLLTHLATLVDSPENVAMTGLSPRLNRELTMVAVVPRDEDGDPLFKTDVEVNAYLDTISAQDGYALSEWIQEHLIDFFMKGVQSTTHAMKALHLEAEKVQPNLTNSSTGSQN